MAIMDREYVREAPRWHMGETNPAASRRIDYAGALATCTKEPSLVQSRPEGAPSKRPLPHAPRARTSAAQVVCGLVFASAMTVFGVGAFASGSVPEWLVWTALCVALLFGLGATGMQQNAKEQLEAQRYAQIVDALNRR